MTVISREVTTEDRLGRGDALDLEPIVYTLMHPGPGQRAPSPAGANAAPRLTGDRCPGRPSLR